MMNRLRRFFELTIPGVEDEDTVLDEFIRTKCTRVASMRGVDALREVFIVLQRDHQRIKALEERIAALEQQVGRPPVP